MPKLPLHFTAVTIINKNNTGNEIVKATRPSLTVPLQPIPFNFYHIERPARGAVEAKKKEARDQGGHMKNSRPNDSHSLGDEMNEFTGRDPDIFRPLESQSVSQAWNLETEKENEHAQGADNEARFQGSIAQRRKQAMESERAEQDAVAKKVQEAETQKIAEPKPVHTGNNHQRPGESSEAGPGPTSLAFHTGGSSRSASRREDSEGHHNAELERSTSVRGLGPGTSSETDLGNAGVVRSGNFGPLDSAGPYQQGNGSGIISERERKGTRNRLAQAVKNRLPRRKVGLELLRLRPPCRCLASLDGAIRYTNVYLYSLHGPNPHAKLSYYINNSSLDPHFYPRQSKKETSNMYTVRDTNATQSEPPDTIHVNMRLAFAFLIVIAFALSIAIVGYGIVRFMKRKAARDRGHVDAEAIAHRRAVDGITKGHQLRRVGFGHDEKSEGSRKGVEEARGDRKVAEDVRGQQQGGVVRRSVEESFGLDDGDEFEEHPLQFDDEFESAAGHEGENPFGDENQVKT
ncbi:hypothetical protein FKW77_006118 [Venturia effusa]|uniref:Uncharacterized protein n=1 Tax=Venturia effusa TaxID=50376 RepID=A0A517L5H8_9PEZI|nr:hypothetical protein FKW77_006118 [Venturia effusa]